MQMQLGMQKIAKRQVTLSNKAQDDQNRRVQTEAFDVDEFDVMKEIKTFQDISNLKNRLKLHQYSNSKGVKKSTKEQTTSTMNIIQNMQQTVKKQRKPQSIEKKSVNNNNIMTERFDYSTCAFTNLKVIGSGSFGVVYKARVNETGEVVAIKKVLQDKRYKNRELQILQELDHPNVLKMKHAYFTDTSNETYLNVVMEYFPETLYSYNRSFVKDSQRMTGILCKIFSYQLLRSIHYIGSLGICHRDIKPHNILVNPQTNKLQLCDFGSAKKLIRGEPNIAYICSRCYRAPELIFGATDYDPQIDVWSVGCVIAELFNGEPLFLGDSAVDQLVEIIKVLGTPSKQEVLSMNKSYDVNQYKFVSIKQRDWKRVLKTKDPEAIDLTSKLLTYCPKTRLTALQALQHPYYDELRDYGSWKNLQSSQGIQIPELFDFTIEETAQMSASQLRHLIPDWYNNSNKILKTIEGYLEKKSPSKFKGYQKRYFVVREQGTLLFYYKSQPNNSNTKPQGIIAIQDIQSISLGKSQYEFIISIPGRDVELKADSTLKRDQWISGLQTLITQQKKANINSNQDATTTRDSQIVGKGNWQNLDQETRTRIQLEDEKQHYEKNNIILEVENDEVLKCKGLYPYINKLTFPRQEQYLLCGFLMKKGKLVKVQRAKRRWFFLMSSVPLNDKEKQEPPTQNDIPDTFSLDHIYYFKYESRGDKTNYINKIPIYEITDPQLLERDDNILRLQKLPYGFLFNYKGRIYNIFSEHLTEIKKWLTAIETIQKQRKTISQDQLLSTTTEEKEEILYEGELEKKYGKKRLLGKLSWRQTNATLKINSLKWILDENDPGNQYVLLIQIKTVVPKIRSFQIFTKDGQEFKFRAQTQELCEKWCQQIVKQVKAITNEMVDLDKNLQISNKQSIKSAVQEKQKAKTEEIQKSKEKEELEDSNFDDRVLSNYAMSLLQSKVEDKEEKSFFKKYFCFCCNQVEEPENDRGF